MNEKELKKLIEDLKSSNLKIYIIEKIKPSAKSLREEFKKTTSIKKKLELSDNLYNEFFNKENGKRFGTLK